MLRQSRGGWDRNRINLSMTEMCSGSFSFVFCLDNIALILHFLYSSLNLGYFLEALSKETLFRVRFGLLDHCYVSLFSCNHDL